MGEFATRLDDGERVKIGTCGDMFYLRYEDRTKVKAEPGDTDPVAEAHQLRFRLPFPDEDSLQPGEYHNAFRGERLARMVLGHAEDFKPELGPGSLGLLGGSLQLRHECGLIINVPCHHGLKLPDVNGEGGRMHWNGKSWFLELFQVKPTTDGVKPIVRCRWCRDAWRFEWSEIWDYILDEKLKSKLEVYRHVQAPANEEHQNALNTISRAIVANGVELGTDEAPF